MRLGRKKICHVKNGFFWCDPKWMGHVQSFKESWKKMLQHCLVVSVFLTFVENEHFVCLSDAEYAEGDLTGRSRSLSDFNQYCCAIRALGATPDISV